MTQGHCATAGPRPYILSLEQSKRIHDLRFQAWKEDPENFNKIKQVERRHNGVGHKITRDLMSMHRTACKEAFGGIEWMNLLIAVGRFDDLIMCCMNEAVIIRKQQLREKREAKGETWKADEDMPPAEKVSASSRDQKTVRGIQHKTSAPKRLREALRQKQNQLKKMEEQWDKGKYVSWHAWTALKYEVEELAKTSDEASWAAGVAFTDSKGVRQLEPEEGTRNLVDIALSLYKKYQAKAVEAAA